MKEGSELVRRERQSRESQAGEVGSLQGECVQNHGPGSFARPSTPCVFPTALTLVSSAGRW